MKVKVLAVRLTDGPVLLDYPYIYPLDGKKLYCSKLDPITNLPCNGEIDYDEGFNTLICYKCGKRYLATDLRDNSDNNKIIIKGGSRMKIAVKIGDKFISSPVESKEVMSPSKKSSKKESKLVVKVNTAPKAQKKIDEEEVNPSYNFGVKIIKGDEVLTKEVEKDNESAINEVKEDVSESHISNEEKVIDKKEDTVSDQSTVEVVADAEETIDDCVEQAKLQKSKKPKTTKKETTKSTTKKTTKTSTKKKVDEEKIISEVESEIDSLVDNLLDDESNFRDFYDEEEIIRPRKRSTTKSKKKKYDDEDDDIKSVRRKSKSDRISTKSRFIEE